MPGRGLGERIAAAIGSDVGWKVAVLGFLITTAAAMLLLVAGRLIHRLGGHGARRACWPGAQTQPAILAFANERTGFDTRVGLGYVLVYPIAMIAKIIIVQFLVGLS